MNDETNKRKLEEEEEEDDEVGYINPDQENESVGAGDNWQAIGTITNVSFAKAGWSQEGAKKATELCANTGLLDKDIKFSVNLKRVRRYFLSSLNPETLWTIPSQILGGNPTHKQVEDYVKTT
jgi:hypothetical protein